MLSMKVTRRQFLKWLSASAAALGLSQTDLLKVQEALAAWPGPGPEPDPTNPFGISLMRIIWIAGAACSGCPTSLLNYIADKSDPDFVLNEIANNFQHVPALKNKLVDVKADGQIDISEVLLEVVTIDYSQIVMAAAGDHPNNYLANLVQDPTYKYVLLIEGSIQTRSQGKFCRIMDIPGDFRDQVPLSIRPYLIYDDVNNRTEFTMAGAAYWLASSPRCQAVVAFGTCAAFGGIPAASAALPSAMGGGRGNLTGAKSAWEWLERDNPAGPLGKTILNVPGCPPHPDWFIHTAGVAALLLNGLANLLDLDMSNDHLGRPRLTQKPIYHAQDYPFCKDCPRNPSRPGPPQVTTATTLDKARRGVPVPPYKDIGLCLETNGCNGYMVGPAHIRPDCPTRKWNNHTNWCVGNNMPCQGCASPGFPDKCSPFYKREKHA